MKSEPIRIESYRSRKEQQRQAAGHVAEGTAVYHFRDISFKTIFRRPELFAQLLDDYVPAKLLKGLPVDWIEDMPEEFVSTARENRSGDTVKKIGLPPDASQFAVCLLEHQSSVDHDMAFRMLRYVTACWERFAKKENARRRGASQTADFQYPLVLPIVYYDGPGKWNAAVRLSDRTFSAPELEQLLPRFEYHLIDLSQISEEELLEKRNLLSVVLLVDKLKSVEELASLSRKLAAHWGKLDWEGTGDLWEVVRDVAALLLSRINVPETEILEFLNQIFETKEGEKMFAMLEKYDVQETRRLARAEGMEEGWKVGAEEGRKAERMQLARKLLEKGSSMQEVSEITGMTLQELQKL